MREKSYKGGYFKAPDFIFELGISPNAKLMLLLFCRRADPSGRSFPSIEQISGDTGIKSRTSARKYILELIKNGHITKLRQGKKGVSNRYQLSETILNIVRVTGDKPEDSTRSNFDHPTLSDPDTTRSKYDYPRSKYDP